MGIKEFVLQQAKNEGMEIASLNKNIEFAKTLLTQTDFSLEKIAGMVKVPVSFVEEIKASLNQASN